MLLRTAAANAVLYSSFQSVLLSKFACCVTALVGIRRGQADSESPAVDLEGQPALFVIIGLPAQIGITEYSFRSEHQSQAL